MSSLLLRPRARGLTLRLFHGIVAHFLVRVIPSDGRRIFGRVAIRFLRLRFYARLFSSITFVL